MDDEDDKKDGEDVEIPDGALDDALGDEEAEDDDTEADPLSAIDEFGGGDDFDGKQWE